QTRLASTRATIGLSGEVSQSASAARRLVGGTSPSRGSRPGGISAAGKAGATASTGLGRSPPRPRPATSGSAAGEPPGALPPLARGGPSRVALQSLRRRALRQDAVERLDLVDADLLRIGPVARGEDGLQREVVGLADRVVLVVVAPGASHGQAEERLAGGV